MAIKIDGIVYRNLQEQVEKNKEDIEDFQNTVRFFETAGFNIVGQLDSVDQLPDPLEYTHQGALGDVYLIGNDAPYEAYVFIQDPKWLRLGQFPSVGPKGDTGEAGPKGDTGETIKWKFGRGVPTITGKDGDLYLETETDTLYVYENEAWSPKAILKGDQGVKGEKGDKGDTGDVGPVGPVGPQGPEGNSYWTKDPDNENAIISDKQIIHLPNVREANNSKNQTSLQSSAFEHSTIITDRYTTNDGVRYTASIAIDSVANNNLSQPEASLRIYNVAKGGSVPIDNYDMSIGNVSRPFKDLYLKGNIISNGKTIPTSDIASLIENPVIANPAGTATGSLSSIEIQGVKYSIQGTGSGNKLTYLKLSDEGGLSLSIPAGMEMFSNYKQVLDNTASLITANQYVIYGADFPVMHLVSLKYDETRSNIIIDFANTDASADYDYTGKITMLVEEEGADYSYSGAKTAKSGSTSYTAGDGIKIENDTISVDTTTIATQAALNTHVNNSTIHVTAGDKIAWSQKVNQDQIADMATKTYVDTKIGDIDAVLDAINGEVI